MPITTSTTLVHGSKFLASRFQASYSFNNSNKAGFVDIDHHTVINHSVHYACVNFKQWPTNEYC